MKRRDIPMSCARTQVLLDAYIDGDLRPERQQRVEAHLHSCGDCQASLAAARRVQHLDHLARRRQLGAVLARPREVGEARLLELVREREHVVDREEHGRTEHGEPGADEHTTQASDFPPPQPCPDPRPRNAKEGE